MNLDDIFEDGIDKRSERVSKEDLINTIQTKSVFIKIIPPDYPGPFIGRLVISKPDPAGFHIQEEKLIVNIDSERGDPRNLEEGVPPHWLSVSGKIIDDPSLRGICNSRHHKLVNRNVRLGDDGELVFRYVRAEELGLNPSLAGSKYIRAQVARCNDCLKIERRNMALGIGTTGVVGLSILIGMYIGAGII